MPTAETGNGRTIYGNAITRSLRPTYARTLQYFQHFPALTQVTSKYCQNPTVTRLLGLSYARLAPVEGGSLVRLFARRYRVTVLGLQRVNCNTSMPDKLKLVP